MYTTTKILPDSLFHYQNHLNIQQWLEKKNCFLKDFQVFSHLFSDYITIMGETLNVNPKLILVSLQREQGLISKHDIPSEKVLNRALGVGCYDDGTDNSKFTGFVKQIDGCMSTYLKWFNRDIRPMLIDGKSLLPENHFTYALYNYTPHVEAGKLTYDIWAGWFPNDLTEVI